jgi:integrase
MRNPKHVSGSDATAPAGGSSPSSFPSQPEQQRKAKTRNSRMPRGITEVRWENESMRDSVRYRVRINRKTFKADKLFENYDDALDFLLRSKTHDGRLGLTEREQRAKLMEQAAVEAMMRRDFGSYMHEYIRQYIDTKPEPNEVKKRSKKIVRDRVMNLMNVQVAYRTSQQRAASGAIAQMISNLVQRKPLGRFYLDDIDTSVANDFIIQRAKTHAHSTVKRELGQLQTIWNKIKHIDPAAWKKLPPDNPWQSADADGLLEDTPPRERDISEEEELRLVAALSSCRNKDVPRVVGVALATGMRRSEILLLEWGQISADGFLRLKAVQTKSSKPRYVALSEDARQLLEGVRAELDGKEPKPGDRVFKTTVDAFKQSFKRVRARAGLKDLWFHDTRRAAITRMLLQMVNPSPVLISAMTGMQSIHHIEENFVKPFADRERAKAGRLVSEADIRANVGHSDARMTKHYAVLGPKSSRAPVSPSAKTVRKT